MSADQQQAEDHQLFTAILESGNHLFIDTLTTIEQLVEQHGIQGIAFSFNGGKDCTVVLHLLRAVFGKLNIDKHLCKVVYFVNNDFKELVEFMKEVTLRHGFSVVEINDGFKEGIQKLKVENPKLQYFFMGQRRNDPHAKDLKMVHISDVHKGWPEFYRVNPIIDWSYKDVWEFLRNFKLSYCSLYDQGYTSLGSHQKTSPNAALRKDNEFLPAYLLDDEGKERAGRTSNA